MGILNASIHSCTKKFPKLFIVIPTNVINFFFLSYLVIPLGREYEGGSGIFISICTDEAFYAKHRLEYDSEDALQIYFYFL